MSTVAGRRLRTGAELRPLALPALLAAAAVLAQGARELELPPTYDKYLRGEVYEQSEPWRDPEAAAQARWRAPEPAPRSRGRIELGLDAEDDLARARREMRVTPGRLEEPRGSGLLRLRF